MTALKNDARARANTVSNTCTDKPTQTRTSPQHCMPHTFPVHLYVASTKLLQHKHHRFPLCHPPRSTVPNHVVVSFAACGHGGRPTVFGTSSETCHGNGSIICKFYNKRCRSSGSEGCRGELRRNVRELFSSQGSNNAILFYVVVFQHLNTPDNTRESYFDFNEENYKRVEMVSDKLCYVQYFLPLLIPCIHNLTFFLLHYGVDSFQVPDQLQTVWHYPPVGLGTAPKRRLVAGCSHGQGC